MENGLFTMLKGEPGTRKSTCALSYPMPQYWFSTDQKMEALHLPAKKWGLDTNKIDFDDYTDWDKPRAKLESFLVNCKYKTIIVDSVTSSGDAMTSQVKKLKKSAGGAKTIGNITVSGFEEFNAESAAFQEMIALLKDIHKYHKAHVILIAHVLGARKDNDANKTTHHSRIIVTGAEKISAKIASYVTEAYHFNIVTKGNFDADAEGKYGLFTSHTGNDYARTSLPLPREIVFNDEPLYPKYILPAINQLQSEIVSSTPTHTQPNVTTFAPKP